MEEVAPVLGAATVFGILGWMLRMWLTHRRQVKMYQLQSDMQSRLLDKFGTSKELLDYLQSESGSHFLQSASIERTNPFRRILGSIQVGIVLTMAGFGFLFTGFVVNEPDAQTGFWFLSALGLAVGIGFALSGAVAYYLSRSWGLIDTDTPSELDDIRV